MYGSWSLNGMDLLKEQSDASLQKRSILYRQHAEGFGRYSKKDKAKFYRYSQGSML